MSRGFGPTLGQGSTDFLKGPVINLNTQFSASAWLYINGLGGDSFGVGWAISSATGSNISCAVYINGSLTSMGFQREFTSSKGIWLYTVPSKTWFNLTLTYNGSSTSNAPSVYINGNAVSTTLNTTPSGTLTSVDTNFSFSGPISNPASYQEWDGMCAHLAFWNGILLTAGDALALGTGANPLLVRPDALSSYMPLDGVNNPEPDLINGASLGLTGTRLGTSEPPTGGVALSKTPALLDMSINIPVVPWRRPGLTYRRIAA